MVIFLIIELKWVKWDSPLFLYWDWLPHAIWLIENAKRRLCWMTLTLDLFLGKLEWQMWL